MSALLHDQDFLLWSERQAELLRAGRLAELDIEGLQEEVEDMGREQKRDPGAGLRALGGGPTYVRRTLLREGVGRGSAGRDDCLRSLRLVPAEARHLSGA